MDTKVKYQMIKGRYMMATDAFHKWDFLPGIKTDLPEICFIPDEDGNEDKNNYYGRRVLESKIFIGIRFPRKTTRYLSEEEINRYSLLLKMDVRGGFLKKEIPPLFEY